MLGLGLNQSDVDGLYDRLPAAALAMGGATTAAKAWFDFCIIILFATYLVIEKGGTRQAPGYINARVYKKFMEPFNPNQPPGQRRQRLAPLHKQLDRSIQRKLREHYDVFVTAFDEFDVLIRNQGDLTLHAVGVSKTRANLFFKELPLILLVGNQKLRIPAVAKTNLKI